MAYKKDISVILFSALVGRLDIIGKRKKGACYGALLYLQIYLTTLRIFFFGSRQNRDQPALLQAGIWSTAQVLPQKLPMNLS